MRTESLCGFVENLFLLNKKKDCKPSFHGEPLRQTGFIKIVLDSFYYLAKRIHKPRVFSLLSRYNQWVQTLSFCFLSYRELQLWSRKVSFLNYFYKNKSDSMWHRPFSVLLWLKLCRIAIIAARVFRSGSFSHRHFFSPSFGVLCIDIFWSGLFKYNSVFISIVIFLLEGETLTHPEVSRCLCFYGLCVSVYFG